MQTENPSKKAFEEKMKKEHQKDASKEILQKELKNEINMQAKDSKDIKIDELVNDIKRLQADFQNHCKRIEQEKKEFTEYASSGVLCKILTIVDELEIALRNMKNAEDQKGIQIVLTKLKKILTEEGVTEMICKGQKFDPYRHEVILYEDGKEDGIILDEIQKGYQIKQKILRYPKVKVSRNESNEAKPQTNKNNETKMEGE